MFEKLRRYDELVGIRVPLLHLLNLLDAILTLYALEQGVEELNPVMSYLHGISPHLFLIIKVLVVSICLCFLDKYLLRFRITITVFVAIYSSIIAWHLYGILVVYYGFFF